MRRLDHNKDGRMTYQDFVMAFDDEAAERLEMQTSHRSEVKEPSLCWGSPLRKSPDNTPSKTPKTPVQPIKEDEVVSARSSLRSKQSIQQQRKILQPQVLSKPDFAETRIKPADATPKYPIPIFTPAPSRPVDNT